MPIVKSSHLVSGRYRLTRGIDFRLSEPKCDLEEIVFKNGATFGATATASSTKLELTSDNTTTTAKNHLEMDCGVSGAVTGSERGIYVHLTNESTSAITGELTAGEFKVRSTSSNTTSIKGMHISCDAKTKTVGTMRGIEISIDGSAGGIITTLHGLRIAANWSASVTTGTALLIDGPAAWTYDIMFQNDAYLVNGSAGDMELTIDNTSTSGRNGWQVDYRVSGACTGSARAGYFHVSNTNASAITGELTGVEAKVRSTSSNTTSAKGIHVSVDAKTKTITTARGIEISIDGSAGGAITTLQGLRIAANWSATVTTGTAIQINGPATWTYDIEFQNSAYLVNGSAGDMELTIDNTSTSGRNGWQVDYRVSGACTGSSRAGYFHVTNTNGTAITGELTGLEAKVRSTSSNTTSAKGIHVSLDCKTKTITTGRGIEISIDGSAGGGITTCHALRIAHNSSASHTTINAVQLEGPGTWSSYLYFGGVGTYVMSFLTAGGEQGFTAVSGGSLKGNVDGYFTIRDVATSQDLYVLCYDTVPS